MRPALCINMQCHRRSELSWDSLWCTWCRGRRRLSHGRKSAIPRIGLTSAGHPDTNGFLEPSTGPLRDRPYDVWPTRIRRAHPGDAVLVAIRRQDADDTAQSTDDVERDQRAEVLARASDLPGILV